MDVDRAGPGALAATVGGALLLLAIFLKWLGAGDESVNAWKIFSFMDIVLFLIAITSIALGASKVAGADVPLPRGKVVKIAGIVALTIVLLTWIEIDNEISKTKFGLWLAFISSVAIVYGGATFGNGTPAAPRTATPPAAPPPPPAGGPPPA